MDPSQEAERIAQITAVMDKLVESGWIEEWGQHKGAYILKWTPKGRERSRWVNEIATELNLGPKGLTALITLCFLHAPKD